MMGHSQQQQQQMLNHHQNLTTSGNDSGGVMGLSGLSMGTNGMQHLNSNSLNIKSDYGLTAL